MTEEEPRRAARLHTAAILAVYAIQGLAFGALVVRVPSLQDQVGVTTDTLALGLALVPVVAGIGSILSGMLVHHRGSRLVLRLTAPLVPLAVLVASASSTIDSLLFWLAVTGLLLGAADAAMAIQAVIIQRVHQRPVIGRGYALFAVGGIVASVLASVTTAAGWPPAQTAMVVAAIGVPVSFLAGLFLSHERYVEQTGAGVGTEVPAVRRLAAPALAVVCAQVIDAAVSTWAALFLHAGLGIDEAGAALGYGAYALASTTARLITDRALATRAPGRVVLMAVGLGALGAVALAFSSSLPAALVALGFLGFGVGPIVPSAFVTLGRDPRSVPRDVARLNACNYIGYLIGTPMVSTVAATAGVTLSIPVTASVLIGAVPLARRVSEDGSSSSQRAVAGDG